MDGYYEEISMILWMLQERLIASHSKYGVFKNMVHLCNLVDLDFIGHKFTWRGQVYHRGSRVYERLDKGLCNEVWRMQLPNALVKVLTHLDFSNHHPILMSA